MTQQELNKAFRDRAEICRDATKQMMKIDLAYDEASLLRIDDIISKAWPKGSSGGDIKKRCEIWASFLGECLRTIFGGDWVRTEAGWGVRSGTVVLNVFAKMEKRLQNGTSDSISFYYETFKKQLHRVA